MFGLERLHSRENPWMEAVCSGDWCSGHQLAHHRWMLDSNLYSDPGSNAIAEEVSLLDPDVREQRDSILGHLPIGKGPINVGSMSMSLLLNGDNPPSTG